MVNTVHATLYASGSFIGDSPLWIIQVISPLPDRPINTTNFKDFFMKKEEGIGNRIAKFFGGLFIAGEMSQRHENPSTTNILRQKGLQIMENA